MNLGNPEFIPVFNLFPKSRATFKPVVFPKTDSLLGEPAPILIDWHYVDKLQPVCYWLQFLSLQYCEICAFMILFYDPPLLVIAFVLVIGFGALTYSLVVVLILLLFYDSSDGLQ